MKLRIRGNSVRLRLTQEEVAAIGQRGEAVMEKTEFGASLFSYRLWAGNDWNATFSNGAITVTVPGKLAEVWATTDQVGLETTIEYPDGSAVHIIVEKDFACLKPRGEEDAGTFPHPEAGNLTC